jgi:hydrogenase maturation protease
MADRACPPKPADRRRILVAGIGNVFLGDDGFGVEVARRLRDEPLGDGVDVADFGVRGVHLAYELAGGEYDAAILVDAVPRGGAPGTLYALEPDADDRPAAPTDAHNLTPEAVLAWVRRVGGRCGRVVIVGCEPGSLDEAMELSEPVAASIDGAMQMVRRLVVELTGEMPCA